MADVKSRPRPGGVGEFFVETLALQCFSRAAPDELLKQKDAVHWLSRTPLC